MCIYNFINIYTHRDGATWGPRGALAPLALKKKKKKTYIYIYIHTWRTIASAKCGPMNIIT
jgi:hypothetical protein